MSSLSPPHHFAITLLRLLQLRIQKERSNLFQHARPEHDHRRKFSRRASERSSVFRMSIINLSVCLLFHLLKFDLIC